MKYKLNERRALFLMVSLLYVNALRPFSLYQYAALSVDLLIICFIFLHLFTQRINKNIFFLIMVLSGFLFLSVLQMFNPNIPELSAGIEGLRKTSFALILVFIGLLSFKDIEKINWFIKKFTILSVPLMLYGIKQYFSLSEFDYLYLYSNAADIYTGQLFGKVRATSVFSGPFHFGMFAAFISLLGLYLYKHSTGGKNKLGWFVVIVVSLLACYTSLTRTNLVAALISIALFYTLIYFKKFFISIPILVICSFFSFSYLSSNVSTLLMSENSLLRMLGTIFNATNDTRFLGRTHGWQAIIDLVKERPFVAYGTGSAGDTLQNTYSFEHHETSHNYFLKVLMETGFTGLMLIFAFLVITSVLLLMFVAKARNEEEKMIFALSLSIFSIFIINSLVNSAIETYPVSGFILMFFAMGASYGFSESRIKGMPEGDRKYKNA